MSPNNQAAGDRPGSMSKLAPELVALYDEYSSYLASGKRGAFKAANPLTTRSSMICTNPRPKPRWRDHHVWSGRKTVRGNRRP
jgi:hypothetical protein